MKAKKTWVRDSFLYIIIAVIILSSCAVIVTSEESSTPALSIDHFSLSYSSEIYIAYAVSYSGFSPSSNPIKMLFWNDARENFDYTIGSQDYISESRGKTKINGEDHYVFYSSGIAPKELTDEIFCRAYVTINGNVYYSEPVKYSGISYLSKLLSNGSTSENDSSLALALISYGAAAQVRFDHKTDYIISDDFYSVDLENAHLGDGFSYGVYKSGTVITVHADNEYENKNIKWYDENNNLLGTGNEFSLSVERDLTVHPVYSDGLDIDSFEGKTFSAGDNIQIPYFYTGSEMTIEAFIKLPTSYSGRGGVIFGSYDSPGDTMNLEIYTGGKVRLYFTFDDKKSSYSIIFDSDIRGDDIKYIAVTVPSKGGKCKLYIDGQLAEEKTMPCNIPLLRDYMLLGGDRRDGNGQFFKGTLYSLAVYKGIRSEAAVYTDSLFGPDYADSALMNAYRFDTADNLTDYGKSGKDLTSISITGLSLENVSERYSLTDTFECVPLTFEALIDTSADVSNKKGCTIIGNYNDTYVPGISFRVYLDGRPCLTLRYDQDHQDQFFITGSVLGKGRVHIAFSIDDTYVYGYVNGNLKLKKAHCGYLPDLTPYPFSIGGDNRTDNSWWFRDGNIYSINLFSEYRTADQIAEDINRIDTEDPELMLSFDFEKSTEDRSHNNNRIVPYFYEKDFVDPDLYDYTFACVGDTQSLVKLYPEELHSIYDFIIENVDNLKIERVIGLGDMTEDNTADQWELVSNEVFRLDGIVPYTVIRGNHDHFARTTEAEATKELMFGYYFDNETYSRQYDGSYDGTPHNTYTRFNVCGIQYLLICLDYGPDDDVLEWASGIVEQYPHDNVIIATHAFLFHDGTTLDENDICPPKEYIGYNNCDEMWDKFVSKYENIVLVLCGHDPSNEIVVSRMTGVNGNTVISCLINPQHTDYYDSASGLVALLHFADGGRKIIIENYSTVKGKFYKTDNEIIIENVNVISH